jgi:glycosyl transferase family 25
MALLLAAARLDYTLIEAVDGNLLAQDTLKSVVRADPGYEPVPAQVGCFLSHREAWRQIAMGQSTYGLILEDDLIFAANFGELIGILETDQPDVDILRLEGWPGRFWARKPVKRLDLGYWLYRLDWSTYGTGCYLISKACAARLLEEAQYYTRPIDNMLFRAESPLRSSIRIYSTSPAACYQHAFFTGRKENAEFLTSGIVPASRRKRQKTAVQRISDEVRRLTQRLERRLTGWRRISTPLHPIGVMPIPEGPPPS